MAVYDLPAYQEPTSILTKAKSIPRNPQLPQTPLGAYTDAQFEAADAQAKADYLKKYNDIIRQIGYVDPHTGAIIKGDIESSADVERAKLQHDMFYAGIDTINQAQNEGNYFSGYQAQRFGRSQYPFITQIAELDSSVARQIAQAQEDAASALSDYILGRNINLADAASRKADALRNSEAPAPESSQYPGQQVPNPPGANNPAVTYPAGPGGPPSTAPPEAFFGPIAPPPMPPEANFGPITPPPKKPPKTAPPQAFFGGINVSTKSK